MPARPLPPARARRGPCGDRPCIPGCARPRRAGRRSLRGCGGTLPVTPWRAGRASGRPWPGYKLWLISTQLDGAQLMRMPESRAERALKRPPPSTPGTPPPGPGGGEDRPAGGGGLCQPGSGLGRERATWGRRATHVNWRTKHVRLGPDSLLTFSVRKAAWSGPLGRPIPGPAQAPIPSSAHHSGRAKLLPACVRGLLLLEASGPSQDPITLP